MREFLIFGLIALGTLGMRAVFLVSSARLPETVERYMRHAKPAILAALVGSSLAGGDGGMTIGSVAALVVAVLLARRGSGMMVVLAGAMAVATLLLG